MVEWGFDGKCPQEVVQSRDVEGGKRPILSERLVVNQS